MAQVTASDKNNDIVGCREDVRKIDLGTYLSSNAGTNDGIAELCGCRDSNPGMTEVVFLDEDRYGVAPKSGLPMVQNLFEVFRFPQSVELNHWSEV